MLRDITREEMHFVSGGDIVVTAPTGGLSEFDRWLLEYARYQANVSFSEGGGGGGGGYSVSVDIGEPIPYNPDDWVDTDGDGVEDTPVIVVEGPPRMATEWEELSDGQKAEWLAGFVFSGGNDVVADVGSGSDLSGGNPDNPYQSEEEALEDYRNLSGDAIESAADAIGNYPIP